MPLLDERAELTKVRDQLRASPDTDKFCMSFFESDCGTAGCIAGWIFFNNRQLIEETYPDTESGIHIREVADALGYEGSIFADRTVGLPELFYMNSVPDTTEYPVTPLEAAQAIDNYLENGRPRWLEVLDAHAA